MKLYSEEEYREAAAMVAGSSRVAVSNEGTVRMEHAGAYVPCWIYVGDLDMRMLGYADSPADNEEDMA